MVGGGLKQFGGDWRATRVSVVVQNLVDIAHVELPGKRRGLLVARAHGRVTVTSALVSPAHRF